MRVLRESPTTLACLAALVLFVIWASDQAGYPATHWEPGALIVLALLVTGLVSVPIRLGQLPAAVRLALACLAAITLLGFLSILWASVRADAWEGADRSLLYLLVFALFALWPRRGSSAALLLGAWVLAMIGLAAFVLLHLDTRSSLQGFFKGDRLAYPGGYENASAATWAMVMWPAWLLAAGRSLPWAIRGALAGGIVLLGDLALLGQSRGTLFSTPVMLALVFAFYPARVRAFALLVPVAGGLAATAPAVLSVGDRIEQGGDVLGALHSAVGLAFAVAVAVGLVVAAGAAIESRGSFSASAARQVRRGVGALALASLIAVPAAGLAAAVFAGTAAVRARARSRRDPLAATVACAALAGFGYWIVHGSFDWFWEFAGLGAPAFALLGLACSLAPRARSQPPPPVAARSPVRLGLRMAASFLLVMALAASLLAPWLSQLKLQEAARIWTVTPQDAYSALNEAADLNPLSDQPYLLAGSIALRFNDLARADREFSRALRRSSRDAYATLERGAIASARGERARALQLLGRDLRLDPRDPRGRAALALTRRGGRVDLQQLNQSILAAARPFR